MTEGGHVVLVGLMGSGKSTVGPLLAERLGRRFVDSDLLIEAAQGRTVRQIFTDDGERAFRALERQVLHDALGCAEPLVIAAAGGVVLDPANRAALADERHLVAWLRAEPALLATRAASGDHRPLLDGDPLGRLEQMAADRQAWYAEVADLTIDVRGLTPADVADLIEAAA